MTNTKCKFYRTSECPEEEEPLIICDLCKKCEETTPEKKFESFCKDNDLEYDFSTIAGYYRKSETLKAFSIFKWAPKERK